MTLNMSTRSSTLNMDFESRTSAHKSKFIKDRVTEVETALGNLCDTFGSIARKNSKLRDKHDELSRHLLDYSENLNYNSSSKASLAQVARELATCNDYQDTMVKRIESYVVEPLMLFDTVIKNSREDINGAFKAYDNEQKSKKAVDRMREGNPSDRHKLSQAETEHQKASLQASRSAKALEEAIDSFEERKLRDTKHTVGSYIKIQMSYHAKCLEALTKAYRNLAILDEADDLDEFRNVLHPTSAAERLEMMKKSAAGGSRHSLTSQRSEASQRSVPRPKAKADMFATSGQQVNPSPRSSTHSTPTKSAPGSSQGSPIKSKSAMMGDDETDSEEEETDSEEELPTYSKTQSRRK